MSGCVEFVRANDENVVGDMRSLSVWFPFLLAFPLIRLHIVSGDDRTERSWALVFSSFH
ncbi:hypothetical protein [Tolypothrix sp. NIES-4075]|uniref:hypothetical protein n=1 Tax=Tolypothrix sp. NIES-4075 TaxID=2005459 RepID=UPI00135A0F37|nr:hypothetical protein [Tolypothrix sp. NIES-4075]